MPKQKRISAGQLVKVYLQVDNITRKGLKGGNIKTLTFNDNSILHKGMTFALSIEILKYNKIIDKIINSSEILKRDKNAKKDVGLLRIIIYELFFGEKKDNVEELFTRFDKIKFEVFKLARKEYDNWSTILKNLETPIESLIDQKFVKTKTHQHESEINLIRYIRINTLKTTKEQIINKFKQLGYTFHQTFNNIDENNTCIVQDNHLNDILALYPFKTELHQIEMIKNYEIIAQDKSSCFPPFVLHEVLKNKIKEKDCFIDACAAPGNKTSYLAALFKNHSVFAFERDRNRFKTLRDRMNLASADNVECNFNDFSKVNPLDEKYSNVRAIMLDPSCSGSGIGHEKIDEQRLLKLQQFQLTLLKHCFKFPNVEYIVYSTCSLCSEENEQVVELGLTASEGKFETVKVFEQWPHRGLDTFPTIGDHCIRVDPRRDRTNGFFLACFKRKLKEQNLGSSTNNNESSKENHKFKRIIIIHTRTGITIFDYCFPNAWTAKKADIGGFLASCHQFDATVKGGGIRKIVFQPPIGEQPKQSLNNTSQLNLNNNNMNNNNGLGLNLLSGHQSQGKIKSSPLSTTAPTGGFQTLGNSNQFQTLEPQKHVKTVSSNGINILSGFNTIRRRSVHHRSKGGKKRTCLNFDDPLGINTSGLMYIVFGLPSTENLSPVTSSSNSTSSPSSSNDPFCLCAVCFEGAGELWTEIAKNFASETINEFSLRFKENMERRKKDFEKLKSEANRDEDLEKEIVEEFKVFEETMNKIKSKILEKYADKIEEEEKCKTEEKYSKVEGNQVIV
ncbi:hypothetical protein ABK040_010083 [Willaertia magna]